MFLGSQLNNSAYLHNQHKNLCRLQENEKTTTTKIKDVVLKLNQRNKFKKNFRCSDTNESSASLTQLGTNNKTLQKCNNHCMHLTEICHAYSKKKHNYEYTERRFNYERMKQQQRSWSLEEQVHCNVPNTRIPTCSDYMNHEVIKNAESYDATLAEFLALRKFREQNSKDCFSNCHHPLKISRAQTPSNHIIKTAPKTPTIAATNKLYWSLNETGGNKNILLTSIPYALRQRMLRDQLTKEFPYRKSEILVLNRSSALSYHSNH